MTIFRYPTPQMAMQKITDFEKLPDAVAKRSGPLVAVILSPSRPGCGGAAARAGALAGGHHRGPIRADAPGQHRRLGDKCLYSQGILGAGAIFAGFFVGGFRHFWWRRKGVQEPEPMIIVAPGQALTCYISCWFCSR